MIRVGLELIGLNEGNERIGINAFRECESLREVDVPLTVEVIAYGVFRKCEHLARLGLNEGLKAIGRKALLECFSLSHIRTPQSVNSIAVDSFLSCSTSLISIELPEESSFNIDLPGCRSLVCVAGIIPTSYFEVDLEAFFGSMLGSLVENEADLTDRLKHRFENSPLNKLCYYQSYQSAQLRRLIEDGLPFSATSQVDEFGMTPLHVLSSSQTPNLDMLVAVMDAGKPGHMVRIRDSFGCTPMDYLCLNRMPNSTGVIRRLLDSRFLSRFKQALGLDQLWESEMLEAINKALAGDWAESFESMIGRKSFP